MSVPFEVVDVSQWAVVEVESLGRKAKVWLQDDHDLWLFKQVRTDEQGARGEDWAEKVVAVSAAALGVPVAHVELAYRQSALGPPRGIISRHVIPGNSESVSPADQGDVLSLGQLQHGNELLRYQYTDYDYDQAGEVPGYTVPRVIELLGGFDAAPGASELFASGAEQFAAYLVMDALVANTDRHHLNWAVVQAADGSRYLAPSYDHGSSLGFQEPIRRKQLHLHRGVEAWTDRARTKFDGHPHPVDAASQALDLVTRECREALLDRVRTFDLGDLEATLERVPDHLMSQVDRRFAREVVATNRRRLLDAC